MERRPTIVELVGPAGVGKSTIWQLLGSRPEVTCASVWGLPRPLLVTAGARTLPAVGNLLRAARGLPMEEIQQLIRLDALNLLLRRDTTSSTIVLDEGPVFALSWFRIVGHPCFRNGRMRGWWRRTLARWAGRLDIVVLLDAPDPLLAHRVRTRAKPHAFRHRPARDIYELNQAYRREFERLLPKLLKRGRPRVVRLNALEATPAELAERVLGLSREIVNVA